MTAANTPEQQPKEYIITAEQLNSIRHFAMAHDAYNVKRILKEIRSRPHPAPAPDDHYTGTCAMQEKCNDYADFCESVMDEITENENEDPPCPIKCNNRVNPNRADCTEAARQAREDVLKEFMDFYEERKKMNPITNQMCIDLLLYKIESLRGERR